jgi:predicted transcriptional regulator of viral defense system
MIKTHSMLLEELRDYKAPNNKIARLVKEGKCIPVVKGLYETDRTVPGYLLAGSIYGPSYLSFDFALSYYGLIPEAVYVYTSATFEKKKAKKYETEFGTFTYRDVPSSAYSAEIKLLKEGEYVYKIASPEKALCDKLYAVSTISNQKELQSLLFEDLRIDETEFGKLDKSLLVELAPLYHSTNLKILKSLLR